MSTGWKEPTQLLPKGAFATAEGADHVGQQVDRTLNVRATDDSGALRGEYPWRTEKGSVIDLARHHPIEVLKNTVSTFAQDAMDLWAPDAEFTLVETTRTGRKHGKASVVWELAGDQRVSAREL